jgi:hypothetical protein
MRMSSHHFVREGQEPALFILEATNYSDTEGLLEWAPLVIVSSEALEEILLWGIKIDVVLARQENIEELTSQLLDQAPIKVLAAGNDPVETALLFLTNAGQTAVSIISKTFSENLRMKIENAPHRIQVTVNTRKEKWAFVSSGIYKKWYQAGAVIDFSKPDFIHTLKSLKKVQNGYELTEDQWISVETGHPFWIGEMA